MDSLKFSDQLLYGLKTCFLSPCPFVRETITFLTSREKLTTISSLKNGKAGVDYHLKM